MSEAVRYDDIGRGYGRTRSGDPRIAALIEDALGSSVTVVNVGAGTGSYESSHRRVLAIEPSATMIGQRERSAAPAILGVAEALPLLDASVDAATAFLTVHHWTDREKGLRELRRVARACVVIFSYLPGAIAPAARWLTSRYFPLIGAADESLFPPASLYEQTLGPFTAVPVLLSRECADGFLDAYWARPECYLDPRVRAGISGFSLMPTEAREEGLARLERELADGTWDALFGNLRERESFDAGLRLIVARY